MIRKHPLAKCEECPLRETGNYVQSPQGPEQGKIAVIGESPSVKDTFTDRLFTGPAGQLLKVVLEHHGIDPAEVIYDNAVACRPADKAAPPIAAINACRERVLGELERRKVETAVLLGNTAAQSVNKQTGVTALRVGPPKPHAAIEDLRTVTTLNPAACLRQGDSFPHLVADIGKVTRETTSWNNPNFVVVDDEDNALAAIAEIRRRFECDELVDNPEKILVVDIEADIDKDISFEHPNQYGMLCVGIGYDRSKVVVFGEGVMGSRKVFDELGSLLRTYRVVEQNGKFDNAGLYPHLGRVKVWFDIMLASYVLDERPGIHSLDYQAIEHLGAPAWKDEIKKYVGPKTGYGAIPRPILYRYNAYDVASSYDLCYLYIERLDKEDTRPAGATRGLRDVHDLLRDASNELMFVELNGIAIDLKYNRQLDIQYIQSLRKLGDDLNRIVGRNSTKSYDKAGGINPRSPQQVKAYFWDKNIRVASTDENTIKAILERTSLPKDEEEVREFCRTLLVHRREAKMHGTYVKGIAKRLYRGRVFPTFLLHGTVTGRLACRNPNLQNIPRESSIRRQFIPAYEDNVFVSTDYSQAELRVLSYLAGDTYFRDIFNAGNVDIFDELTPILYPEANKATMSKEAWKELRIRVKAYVYGLGYGRTEFSIATEFGISVNEAQKGMAAFFDVIPEIVQFREKTRASVLAGEDLITPWGRHRRYPLITKENVKDIMNEALAFIPQSTASDMTLQAMIWTREEIKGLAYIRNLVHDNIMAECKKSDAEEVGAIIERNMLKSAKLIVGDYVKFAVDTTVGNNWGEL